MAGEEGGQESGGRVMLDRLDRIHTHAWNYAATRPWMLAAIIIACILGAAAVPGGMP